MDNNGQWWDNFGWSVPKNFWVCFEIWDKSKIKKGYFHDHYYFEWFDPSTLHLPPSYLTWCMWDFGM